MFAFEFRREANATAPSFEHLREDAEAPAWQDSRADLAWAYGVWVNALETLLRGRPKPAQLKSMVSGELASIRARGGPRMDSRSP